MLTGGYKGIKRISRAYRVLIGVKEGYRKLKRVT